MEVNTSLWKVLRQGLEADLCRLAFWFFPKLPYSFLVSMARALGFLGYYFAIRERRIALANLDAAIQENSAELSCR